MKNPLNVRIFRQMKANGKTYLALFIMLTVVIGFTSGLFVANGSMETAAHNAFTDYNIENGHFELEEEIGELRDKISDLGITLFDQYYQELSEDIGSDGTEDATIRVFAVRDVVNRASLLDGRMPEQKGEIVIDRMHADNTGIKTGDVISVGKQSFTVTGLIASSDYSTLYKKNTDTMFDAITFDIGFVTADQFDELDGRNVWQYAYQFNAAPEQNEKDAAEELAEKIAVLAATGGITDSKDTAKELSRIADEGYLLSEQADALKAKAEPLEKAGDDLKKRGDVLEAEGNKLKERGEALKTEGKALETEKAALEEKGAELQKRAAAATALMETDPARAAAELAKIQTERDALTAQGEELAKKAEDLQARGDKLQAESDELTAKGDALQKEADALEAQGDALQKEKDALEAKGDKLKERLNAIGIEDLDALDEIQTNKLTDFVPEYANQAIHFAVNDFGSDKTMCEYLLIVFVIILAFIFGITAKNAVRRDAAVIGTLRASGYTRTELTFHYVAAPILVTVISAIVGNILGYTLLKNVVVNMYYASYSLPEYVTLYSSEALVKTSIAPLLIMSAVTIFMTAYKMRLSPLKFMRHDLSSSKRKKAVRLPKWKFLNRFRTRVFLRSLGDYLVMFVGLTFVMVMMCFCLGLPSTIHSFIDRAGEFVIADYQTILTSDQDEDDNEIIPSNGEKFRMTELETVSEVKNGEVISVYGFVPDSKYIHENVPDGNSVCVSYDYADKFGFKTGDTISLKEKYSTEIYTFQIGSINAREGTLAVYMPIAAFDNTFDDSLTGYFSDEPLAGVDEDYIAKVITADDLTAMAKQLDHSIGSYAKYFSAIFLVIAAVLLYLLTKQIIEKNSVSISMTKVLGYYNKEINSVYIRTTTICVMIMSVICVFLGVLFVDQLWRAIMIDLSGWFTFDVKVADMLLSVGGTIFVYLLIALADMNRIKKVPMTEALKNAE